MMTDSATNRNDPMGLATRALKNFRAIRKMPEIGADVHVVTQAVLTTYAVILVANERGLLRDKGYTDELNRRGKNWLKAFDHEPGEPKSSAALLQGMRHAIAHANITFSSESRDIAQVSVRFENRDPKKNHQTVWVGCIKATDLSNLTEEIFDVFFPV